MSKKKNQYKSNARKKNFLKGMNEELPTKGNVKNTVLETGKDLLVAVLDEYIEEYTQQKGVKL